MNDIDANTVVKTVHDFVRDRVVPREQEIEDTDCIPSDLKAAAADLGLYGFAIPEEHGGLGLSTYQECLLVMELGWTTPSFRSMFGTNNGIAGHVLIEGGTDAQKKEWLPRLASGEVTASFALTEAEAGSDPSGLRTSATPVADGFELTGEKRFITNAPSADVFMVFARHGAGSDISAFLVPRDAPGLSVGPKDGKMGQKGAWTADVRLDRVPVLDAALIGGVKGAGFRTAMRCLAHGRIHIAALCVGMAQRLLEETVRYAKGRHQSGHPIADFQLIQGLIADSASDVWSSRATVLSAAHDFDSGVDRRMAPSIAKYVASEAVGRVADRAVQVHGGSGYMSGVPVERFYRDARLFRIYEGTSQVQQVIIARQALELFG
jgi:acyl-CoA dehydrogenase